MKENKDEKQQINDYRNIVQRYRSKLNRNRILSVISGFLVAFLAIFLVFLFVEQTSWLSPLLKSVFAGAAVLAGIGAAIWIFKSLNFYREGDYYRRVTRDKNLSSLRYLLDLTAETTDDPSLLKDAAVKQNLNALNPQKVKATFAEWNKGASESSLFKTLSISTLLLLLVTAVFSWQNPNTTLRAGTFWVAYEKPNPFNYAVDPGDTLIEQGSRFYVTANFDGPKPDRVVLSFRTLVEEEFRLMPMEETTPGTFVSESIEAFSDLMYYVRMDEFRSDTFSVETSQIPRFRELVVETIPPGYTNLETQTHTYPFSRIEIPEGSEINIRAKANKDLTDVIMKRRTESNIELANDSLQIWNTTFQLAESDSIRFSLKDADGLANRNPFGFTISAIKDQYPSVRITRPELVVQKLNPESLSVSFEARDDYGFSSIHLRYEVLEGFSDATRRGSVRLSRNAPASVNSTYEWDLRPLSLQAADEVTYWIEVNDNDAFNGFKRAESARHILRATSLAEHFLDQEQREDNVDSALDDLARQSEQTREELRQLREDILQNPDDSWEQQRKVDELMDQQESMKDQLDDMMREFEQLRQELQQDDILSEDTLRKYEELQQLFEEIDDPAIQEMLEKLREGLENMDRDQIREAMENLEFNEQAYQERLERTIELLKQLRINAEMDKMAAMLEELQKLEERIMEMEDTDDQLQQQESVQQQLEELMEQFEQLPEKGPQRRQQMLQDMVQEMMPDMQDIMDRIQQNMEELGQPQPNTEQSRQQQHDISESLGQMSEQMQSFRNQMNQESMSVNIFALKTILQNLILLSDAQEELNLQTLELEPNSLAFLDHARIQRTISVNFNQVADSLMAVAKEVPQFPNFVLRQRQEVQQSLDRSMESLIERNKNNATTAERMVLGGINTLGNLVADLIDQLDDSDGNGGGGGGMSAEQMMQQMQDMSGEQQQLNQMIQDMINDMAGERLTQDQMERLDQMARQQNEIRRQLQEMQRRGALKPGDSLMSEFERLAEEMEDTINELRGGSIDELMVERQQNILSRMLEAEQAIDQREEDDERRGETAEELERRASPEMTLEELEREIRNRLQDPNQTKFTEDYQRLIRLYFEILQETEGTALPTP